MEIAARLAKEMGGIAEYRLPDRTRVDILTNDLACEVDWAKKWAEGIGQSLYYAEMTGRKPCVILIIKNEKDQRFVKRCKLVCDKYKIELRTTHE